jgi:two-component system sensor histidine kinase DesK
VERERIAPATMALLWRLAGVLLPCALWLTKRNGEAGLVLVLLLTILGLARWRFALPAWTTLVDQTACVAVASVFWPDAAFALALPVFDSFLTARPAYALPSLVSLFFLRAWSLPVAAAISVAALAGLAVQLWRYQILRARREADRDRRERYELESLKGELLSATLRVARMAESSWIRPGVASQKAWSS